MPWNLNGTRVRGWALASAIGLAAVSWPATARGAPFELSWAAPEGCPSRETIVAATQARLGDPPSDLPPELFVQGTVEAVPGGFVLTLALRDASGHALGERTVRVEEESCAAIEDPAAVVLALMIGVARSRIEADAERAENADQPAPPPPSTPTPPISRPPAKQDDSPRPAPLPDRLFVGAAGVGTLGALPDAGIGLAVRGMYAPRSLVMLGLEASFEDGGSVRFGGGEVGFQLFTVSARLGLSVLNTGRFELIHMVGVRGGWLRTSPTGFRLVQNETRAMALAGPGVLVRARLTSHLFAELLPELELVAVRDRLQILHGDKLNNVHRPSLFEARVALGISYEFH